MILDVVCLAAMLLFLVTGLISGFLRQVVRIVALVGACLLVSPLGTAIRRFLAGRMDVDGFPGEFLVLLLAWLAGYLILLVAGVLILRAVRGVDRTVGVSDRLLGALLGALKGGLVVYVLVTALLLFQGPMKKVAPEVVRVMDRSRVVELLRENNALLEWMRQVQEQIHRIDLGLPS